MPERPERPERFERTEVRDVAWKCLACDNILGYVARNGTVLRMKYKDFYVFIEEAASVTTLCRKCGRENILNQKTEGT